MSVVLSNETSCRYAKWRSTPSPPAKQTVLWDLNCLILEKWEKVSLHVWSDDGELNKHHHWHHINIISVFSDVYAMYRSPWISELGEGWPIEMLQIQKKVNNRHKITSKIQSVRKMLHDLKVEKIIWTLIWQTDQPTDRCTDGQTGSLWGLTWNKWCTVGFYYVRLEMYTQ